MKIDWFTVIAQVGNFLILVWLLRRFLYKPILNAIDEREKKIKSQLEDAESRKAEAKKEQDEFKQKNDAFDIEKKALMDKVIEESKTAGEKLLEEARSAANTLDSKLKKAFKETQENAYKEIAQKTQQQVFEISRKTLADLASVSLEEQSVTVFINRLNELSESDKKQFVTSFKSNSNPVLIKSAYELPRKQQIEIKNAVKEILGAKVHYEFNNTPELISGIELSANGYKLAWSISEYINSFEKNIFENVKIKHESEVENK